MTSSGPRGLQPLQNIADLEEEIAATNILISFKALLKKSGRRRSQLSPHHKLATHQSVIYLLSARSVLYNKGNKINKNLKSVAGTRKRRPIYVLLGVSSDTNMEGATVHSCSTLISLCTATVMSLRSFQSVRYILITRCLCSL